jgi:hypothetical protein
MSGRIVTVRELNRSLLERQMLLRREKRPALEVIERLVGMQAQVPNDPYVGLWTRIAGFATDELVSLIDNRDAVRVVMLMRTTIHLVSARDCRTIRPLMQPVAERQWGYSPFARLLAGIDVDEVVRAGREMLAERPHTANEMGKRLTHRWPDSDIASLGYAVRTLVPLVQVPPRGIWGRGGQPFLDTVEHWLGRPLDPTASIEDLVVRYLAAFGPASVKDIQVWSWLTGLRDVVERMRPKLHTYRDEKGRELFDVPDGPMPDPDTPAPIRFLPEYDNLLLSHDDRSRVGDPFLRGRPWMRGGILVDGFLGGTWRLDAKGANATLRIGLYDEVSASIRDEIAAEGTDLLAFAAAEGADRKLELVVLG